MSVLRLEGCAPAAGRRLRGGRVSGKTNCAGRVPSATAGRQVGHRGIPISRLRQAASKSWLSGVDRARSARPHQGSLRRRPVEGVAPPHRRYPEPDSYGNPQRIAFHGVGFDAAQLSLVKQGRRAPRFEDARNQRAHRPGERGPAPGAASRKHAVPLPAQAHRGAAKPSEPGKSWPSSFCRRGGTRGTVPRPLMRIREASARRDTEVLGGREVCGDT